MDLRAASSDARSFANAELARMRCFGLPDGVLERLRPQLTNLYVLLLGATRGCSRPPNHSRGRHDSRAASAKSRMGDPGSPSR